MNDKIILYGASDRSQVRSSSWNAVVAAAREQIAVDSFGCGEYERAAEIAKIIAEVRLLPPEASVRIDGGDLPAGLVDSVYRELTAEHVRHVLENMTHIDYRIRHMKTYLRTALYNSAFELDNSIDNEVAADIWNAKN